MPSFEVMLTTALNGQLAVDLVRSARQPFNFILMDLQMPILDGYQVSETTLSLTLLQLYLISIINRRQRC
jgi:CheY-like chemotaxis protein